jgi:hypothetical protein
MALRVTPRIPYGYDQRPRVLVWAIGKNFASLAGQSLPVDDPVAMVEIISRKRSRRGVSKLMPRASIVAAPEPEAPTLQDRLARLEDVELLAITIQFALPRLSDDARAALTPISEITRQSSRKSAKRWAAERARIGSDAISFSLPQSAEHIYH